MQQCNARRIKKLTTLLHECKKMNYYHIILVVIVGVLLSVYSTCHEKYIKSTPFAVFLKPHRNVYDYGLYNVYL